MLPKGFKVGGIRSGLSKNEGKKDLALFISESPAHAAGMFTKNIVKAAPVLTDIERLEKGGKFSGIIANSGCANACTGDKGKKDAENMCSIVEKSFDFESGSVLCASTGVIGQYLSISGDDFEKNVDMLKNNIGVSSENEDEAVLAIMTTDTFIKKTSRKIEVKNGEIKIWGCVKGAGMIHPDMQGLHATMLSFILTDAEIESKTLQKILENSADKSFHCVSVDGDTSTNDTLIVLANGHSGTGKLSEADLEKFIEAFDDITLELAKSVAKDGEGATKFIEIEVKNAEIENDAKLIASTIATSPLLKTAIFGADANWGRVIAAAGRAGVKFDFNKVDIYIGGIHTFKNGIALNFSEEEAKKSLLKKEVKIVVDLKAGEKSSKYYTCDFSYDYVKINGDYRS
ncbi:bifunctional glutamate N-acetyltransferase/amino-acid acetyltransferase ArgJ [Candidatus Endomicrobiellum agilis]|uniref:bifunctional glutamate N-acetyltransferase/amino-acid acetyltransferase ArgJ n=1 Tax=Candidatus Endomicrobiellum agilis TaxID=3238957 RepID=UPI00357A027E|nr:bifunctional glutamate N-acetyltransferase/amino-acid acetyltransferase ArgJ [Endomicrobium sp.]